jgi:regulator of replication initiation timing
MYEIKQSYLIQLENEELRKRIEELRNELKAIKEIIQKHSQKQTTNSGRIEARSN